MLEVGSSLDMRKRTMSRLNGAGRRGEGGEGGVYNYLWSMGEGRYHLLPGFETTQEVQMAGFRSSSLLQTGFFYQKDGSRFKYIRTNKRLKRILKGPDIIHRIYTMMPSIRTIWPQEEFPSDVTRLDGGLEEGRVRLVLYVLHNFLNGSRVLPIIVNESLHCFYEVKGFDDLWKGVGLDERVPEDGMGLLFEGGVEEAKGVLGGMLGFTRDNIQVINYLSAVRLCACCGVVSDHSVVKSDPWKKFANKQVTVKKKFVDKTK